MEAVNCFTYSQIYKLYQSKFVVCKILERNEGGKINLLGVLHVFDNKAPAQKLLEALVQKGDGEYIMIPTFDDLEFLYELDETMKPAPLMKPSEVSDYLKRYYGW